MAAKSWNLLDVDRDVYVDELNVGAKDVPGAPAGFSIRKWTHQGGTSRGVDEIRINNGSLEVSLLPTRGMGLWKAWVGDVEFGWKAPARGPVNPSYVPLMEPAGLGWLDGGGGVGFALQKHLLGWLIGLQKHVLRSFIDSISTC